MSRSERPSDARSEAPLLGTAAGFRPPTARLRLGRPGDARSAKRGEPMPARLRVRRRSLNAPQAGAAACQAAFGAAGFSSPTSRLRLRGVRATRGARSEETTCAQHRRHAMVSRALFAFLEGARQSGDRAWRERAGPNPRPRPRVPKHINLVSQRSQGRYSVVVRDLYRLDCTWLRNHFPKPYYR